MEHGTQDTKKRHLINLVLIAVLIFTAMYLCAITGYRFVRSSTPEEHATENVTQNIGETSKPEEYALPDSPEPDLASASLPKQDVRVSDDTEDISDYLVIAENGVVKLYVIKKSGEQVYKNDLDILPESLMPEDKALLEEGIILQSEEDLAALLEDYTS